MDKSDVLGFAKKAIPWIGAAATGNVPALIAMAAKAVSDTLGVDVATDSASIATAVAGATPDQLIALRHADNEFALRMKELGFKQVVELEALETGDRASARDREVKAQDGTNKVLAYMVILSFLAVIGVTLMGYAVPDSVLAGTLIGYLSAKAEQVLSYYFGSTKNSARKTELLAQSEASK